jgi:Domain of unknown function (DUF4403)
MRSGLDKFIYYTTAPIRLFGRSRKFRLGVGAVCIAAVCFAGSLWLLKRFVPSDDERPERITGLKPPPPLQPVTQTSRVMAPVSIALTAISHALDAAAPREFAGNIQNPVTQLLNNAKIDFTVARDNVFVIGQPGSLTLNAPLRGSVRLSGQTGTTAGQSAGIGHAIGSLIGGGEVGKQISNIAAKALDQSTDFRGNVVVTSQPRLTSAWRIEPNLAGRVDLNSTEIAGMKVNIGNEIHPVLDPILRNQIAALESRVRNDPIIERTAREQWGKICRTIPLGGGATGLPPLWLEMRPIRVAAAQPQFNARNLILTIGVQAETRIVPNETKPNCPFPAQLELVPPMQDGVLAITVPIDMPFTELNQLIVRQLEGRHFPEDGNGPVDVEVLGARLSASGERLLVSLRLKAREKKSWFGFGAEASVHIWGKPVLEEQSQILRLADISLAMESEAAFGLLGAAARPVMPYLQKALAEKGMVDLKPFANDAKTKIDAALAEFRKSGQDVRVDAAVNGLRLIGIQFDARTLRVIAEANGKVNVAVSKLQGP